MSTEISRPNDPDRWECDWESARRAQLRRFRALPLIERLRAVEEMCRVAELLQERRRARRQ